MGTNGKGKPPSRLIKRVLLGLWLALIVAGLLAYFAEPAAFSPERIAAWMEQWGGILIVVYLAISIIRGLTLLPSTAFILAGIILFPDRPWLVFGISMTGILCSSSMIYHFSDYLGFSEFFEEKYPKKIQKLKAKLEQPSGLFFVLCWAWFPLVPTDLICYVAGSSRMDFTKFILALGLGEVLVCAMYIFGGSHLLMEWLG